MTGHKTADGFHSELICLSELQNKDMIKNKKKRLVIIPARAGSRITKKNIKIFRQPIISYALNAASMCNIFDTIHVSTESSEIYEICKKRGYEPHFMTKETANDYVGIMRS